MTADDTRRPLGPNWPDDAHNWSDAEIAHHTRPGTPLYRVPADLVHEVTAWAIRTLGADDLNGRNR